MSELRQILGHGKRAGSNSINDDDVEFRGKDPDSNSKPVTAIMFKTRF